MVKEFLSQRGVAFEERDVSVDRSAAQELVSRTGQMGVPVTVIDGQTVVGFDRARLEQALKQGQQPSLGAAVADASRITAKQGSGITLGAYVGGVRPGSLAQRLGLAAGDIITEVNLQPIAKAADLEQALARMGKGSRLSVVFIRGDRTRAVEGVL
ncbi:MAG: glutaredoxin domain-containing protein [Chloroflexota bacterium]